MKCDRCGRRYDATGAANCSCCEDTLSAYDEAIREGRCLLCLGFEPDPKGQLCDHHKAVLEAERAEELRFEHRDSCFNAGSEDVFLGELYLGWVAKTDTGGRWFAQPLTERAEVFKSRDEAVELLRKARGVPA